MTTADETGTSEIGRIVDFGLIASVRSTFATGRLTQIDQVLQCGGIRVFDVSLNSQDALAHIAALRNEVVESIPIGAGTVRTPELLEQAVRAGAKVAISPDLDLATVEATRRLDVSLIPEVTGLSAATAKPGGIDK